MASVTDNFNRADSDTIGNDSNGNAWVEVRGDWDIISQAVGINTSLGEVGLLRNGSDLSTDDHYAQASITFSDTSSDYAGIGVRVTTDGQVTGYMSMVHNGTDDRGIWRIVNGSFTLLANDTLTTGAETLTGYLEINGSSLKSTFKGVDLTATDSSIVGNLRTGLFSWHEPASDRSWDDFEAADLGGPSLDMWTPRMSKPARRDPEIVVYSI